MTDPLEPSVPPQLTAQPPPRRGLIGPFTGRQLLGILAIVVVAAVGLTLATRPIAAGPGSGPRHGLRRAERRASSASMAVAACLKALRSPALTAAPRRP